MISHHVATWAEDHFWMKSSFYHHACVLSFVRYRTRDQPTYQAECAYRSRGSHSQPSAIKSMSPFGGGFSLPPKLPAYPFPSCPVSSSSFLTSPLRSSRSALGFSRRYVQKSIVSFLPLEVTLFAFSCLFCSPKSAAFALYEILRSFLIFVLFPLKLPSYFLVIHVTAPRLINCRFMITINVRKKNFTVKKSL